MAAGEGRQPGLLSTRALGRATLDRQMLLRRTPMSAYDAVEHLVGLQAQAPRAPYVALWSRLTGFAAPQLADLVSGRRALRAPLMRVTVHLVTDRDALTLFPLLRPMLERSFARSEFGKAMDGLDMFEVARYAHDLLSGAPLTRTQLAERLAERWPDRDPVSLGYTGTHLLPMLQAPPRGLWDETGPVAWAPVGTWLGRAFDPEPSVDTAVLRFLGAFGPASVKDAQTWSGLTRLREVFTRLRPGLAVFRDESGQELFDLPDAPRPDPDTPAPVRFLPEYDNLLLSHADRSRVIVGRRTVPLPPGNGGTAGTVLVDGLFQGTWKLVRERGGAVLRVDPFVKPTAAQHAEIEAEGAALLAFAAPDAESHEVRVGPPPG